MPCASRIADRIGADAEQRGMAEADQPRAADQQSRARRAAIAEDHRARQQRHASQPWPKPRKGAAAEQPSEQQRRAPRAAQRLAHQPARAGNRPRGPEGQDQPPSRHRPASRRAPRPTCRAGDGRQEQPQQVAASATGPACRPARPAARRGRRRGCEPMPPMTMTTKARISTLSPMPGSTERIGAAITPAKPASMAPKPKTSMNRRRISTPSAATIGALVAPARTSMPTRVRSTSHQSSAGRSPARAPMMASAIDRVEQPGHQLRCRPTAASGIGTCSGAAPQTTFTPWFRNRMTPKVASTCVRWSRS